MSRFFLNPAFCLHNQVFWWENDSTITVGMRSAEDYRLRKRIENLFNLSDSTRKKLEFIECTEEECSRRVARLLAQDNWLLRKESPVPPEAVLSVGEGEQDAPDVPAVNILDSTIMEALSEKISDIHMEPGIESDGSQVLFIRFRKNGRLTVFRKLDIRYMQPLILRIKILSGLKSEETRRPQDGRFLWKKSGLSADIRVSCIPVWNGESVVMRLLQTAVEPVHLETLGFSAVHIELMEKLLRMRNRLVLVAGPTGAGKTTTIAAFLSKLSSETCKIITIEDPVEYRIPQVTQIEVRPEIGFSFDAALRHVFRHDPDVLVIGEIRDAATAETAVRAALTGHLVFATVHAADAGAAVVRLLDMGVEAYLLASVFGASIAQYLVPAVSGGRTVVAEILADTPDVRNLIAQKAPASEFTGFMKTHGINTLSEDLAEKQKAGFIHSGGACD